MTEGRHTRRDGGRQECTSDDRREAHQERWGETGDV